MDDKNEQIYSKYQLDIKNIYKRRGFVYLEENDKIYIIKPYNYTEKKARLENYIKNSLIERGFIYIDSLIKNNQDSYISQNRYGNKFVVKRWFDARECDISSLEDVQRASANLAKFHKVSSDIQIDVDEDMSSISIKDMRQEYRGYNAELNRVRKYIYRKKKKNRLEVEILKYIDAYVKEAEYYYDRLLKSNYGNLHNKAIEQHTICHGDYTHHAVLMGDDFVATINFDKLAYGVIVYDLYSLLRKTMEKNDWNIEMGIKLIEEYEQIRELSNDEKELLYIFLSYPDKFRKLVNSYFNGKKALVSIRISEKLNELIGSEMKKKEFLKTLETKFDFKK